MVTPSPDLGGAIQRRVVRKIENFRDRKLSIHEANVAETSEILCRAVGLDEHFIILLKLGAELHDIGKLAISDQLLNKPAMLSTDEMELVRMHSQIGHDILLGTGDPLLDFAASVALSHHENFDGSGYPQGLRGEAIPMGSRIVALCDVYDALRTDRPYRPGLTDGEAMAVITAPEGRASRKSFDPMVVDAFIRCADAIARTYAEASGGTLAPH